MKRKPILISKEINALKVNQWLKPWELVPFDETKHQSKPPPHFYIFSLSAVELKALTGIYRRSVKDAKPRSKDFGIQRYHDESRSAEIREYIRYGYPWSDLSKRRRKSGEFDDLRKPGWLPTAIVVNIVKAEDQRYGTTIASGDIVKIRETGDNNASIVLPTSFTGENWKPEKLYPLEVIDGQHRLWAFQGVRQKINFQLPVVAFHGLDISWQAYLFWTINIKPKRINASLAYDLYPLLRTEDWLQKFTGHPIYRETRSQELTEALWAHPKSPWYQRINMLGQPGLRRAMVSQAAWIRSLMATFVKQWEGKRTAIGGLFGCEMGSNEEVLPWTGAQQSAFLIYAGSKLKDHIQRCKKKWAKVLRTQSNLEHPYQKLDAAFFSSLSLLNTDQGIRGFLYVCNDLCFVRASTLNLDKWRINIHARPTDIKAVNLSIESLEKQKVANFLDMIANALAGYDWRTSAAPGLTYEERTQKAAFRGSGGYKELRLSLLNYLSIFKGEVANASKMVIKAL